MDFTKVAAYIDSLPSAGVPACDLSVFQDHQPVFRRFAGYRDHEKNLPVRGDETYCLYSCTKVFTTCAAMQLIQEGRLHLDDPVSHYLPAYGQLTVKKGDCICPTQRVMTIRHLMSMQSGLDYNLEAQPLLDMLQKTGYQASTRQMIDALALEPLCFEPGENFLYSLSHDVLAAVIEVVSGLRFSEYLSRNIFTPLGLKTVGFQLDEDKKARMCAQYSCNEKTGKLDLGSLDVENYRLSTEYESGGAGLIADVKDCISFADAIACGGISGENVRILSPEMIQLWNSNQLGPESRKSFDEWKRLGYSYGLGVRTRVDMAVGGRGQIGEFGWDGAAGAWMMIDPVHHLSAFYAMHIRNFGYSYDVIHPTIRNLIYEAVFES